MNPLLPPTHPRSNIIMSKFLRVMAVVILAIQAISTGYWFLQNSGKEAGFQIFLLGVLIGLVIGAVEYGFLFYADLENQASQAVKKQLTLSGYIRFALMGALLATTLYFDYHATSVGFMAIGFSGTVSRCFGAGQLVAFEYLFNLSFHLEDAGAV